MASSVLPSPVPPACPPHLVRPDERVRVLLLISSLEHGGAERQVVELMRNFDRRRFDPLVCSLSNLVPLADLLPDRRADLVVLEKRWKFDALLVPRLAALLRERRIDVLHAFLFDAEMAGRLAARIAGVPLVVASERNTDYRRPLSHEIGWRLTRSWYDVLVANSHAGKRFNMRTLSISGERIRVIRNGVDCERFRPAEGLRVRRELKIPEGAPVVGMAAIFKRQKRHADFFRAARGLLDRLPESWFVLAGEPLRANQQGASDYHREVQRVADELGVLPRCVFAGNRNDMPDVYSACDVVMLTSEREGTPNVLLEAMACGVPVIATDVADNARIVPEGEGGFIVPLGDIGAMVERLLRLLTDADFHEQMGGAARAWALRNFSTRVLARRTEQVYLDWLFRKATIRRDRALLARLRSAAAAHDASSTTVEGRDA